jgi:hypothetical protein
MGIRQAFTSYSNPKGKADTERFLRTIKEELVWLREWASLAAFFAALDRWLADYNASYSIRRSATERACVQGRARSPEFSTRRRWPLYTQPLMLLAERSPYSTCSHPRSRPVRRTRSPCATTVSTSAELFGAARRFRKSVAT